MGKHPVKKVTQKEYSSATPTVQETVELNRKKITSLISGSSIKRLNNINWLRHEIAYSEPHILFYRPIQEQAAYFDYSCSKGISDAYDYIIENEKKDITPSAVCDIHYHIAKETNISAGRYRTTGKILEITVNGARIHTPDPHDVPALLDQALYEWKQSTKPYPLRAFDLHYNLIMVHPFDDMNKRTSRMVMNWALLQSGYRPIVFNRKTDKEGYRKALQNMAAGNAKAYYKYMYSVMANSQQKLIDQLKSSRIN